jgi:hypothetical protein
MGPHQVVNNIPVVYESAWVYCQQFVTVELLFAFVWPLNPGQPTVAQITLGNGSLNQGNESLVKWRTAELKLNIVNPTINTTRLHSNSRQTSVSESESYSDV